MAKINRSANNNKKILKPL